MQYSPSSQSRTSYTSVPIQAMSGYYNYHHQQMSPRGTSSKTSEYNPHPQFGRETQSPSRMSEAYSQAMRVTQQMSQQYMSKSPSRQSGYSGVRSPIRQSEYTATATPTERRQCYSPDGSMSRASRYSGNKSPSQHSESGFSTAIEKIALIRELEAQVLKSSTRTSKKTSVENSFVAPRTLRNLKVDTKDLKEVKAGPLQDNYGKKIDQKARGEYSPLVKPQKPEPKTGIRAFVICPPQARDENARDHMILAPQSINAPTRNPITQGDMPRSVRVRSTEQHPTYDYHLLNSKIHFLPSTREDRADKSPSYSKKLWNKTTMEHEKPKPVKTRIIPQNSSEGVKASLIYY